eukprot:403352479
MDNNQTNLQQQIRNTHLAQKSKNIVGVNEKKWRKIFRCGKIGMLQFFIYTLLLLIMQAGQVQSMYGKILNYENPLFAVYSQVENSTDPDVFTINIESSYVDITSFVDSTQELYVAYTMIFGVISQADGYDQIRCKLNINEENSVFICKDQKVGSNGILVEDTTQNLANILTTMKYNETNKKGYVMGNYKVQFQRPFTTVDTTNDYQFLNADTLGSQSIKVIYEFGYYDANENEVVNKTITKPYMLNLMENAVYLRIMTSLVITTATLLSLIL